MFKKKKESICIRLCHMSLVAKDNAVQFGPCDKPVSSFKIIELNKCG